MYDDSVRVTVSFKIPKNDNETKEQLLQRAKAFIMGNHINIAHSATILISEDIVAQGACKTRH